MVATINGVDRCTRSLDGLVLEPFEKLQLFHYRIRSFLRRCYFLESNRCAKGKFRGLNVRFGGGFNRSAQHLLILRGEEVCHGDVADLVHGSAESRAVGAMEERAKCRGHLAGAGKEEQDRR